MKLWEERLLNGARELPYNMPPGMASAVGRVFPENPGLKTGNTHKGAGMKRRNRFLFVVQRIHLYVYIYIHM